MTGNMSAVYLYHFWFGNHRFLSAYFFVVQIVYWQSCISKADCILVISLLVPRKVVAAQLFLPFMERRGSSVVHRRLPLDIAEPD